MKRSVSLNLLLVVLLGAIGAQSQQSAPSTFNQASAVPHLVRFTGVLRQENGKPLTGIAGVTFALYKEDQGGAALWIETQNVQLDASGRYSVMLGATKPDSLPDNLFAPSEARWLGVQAEGQPEQPRVLLVSVPYAMKAADAETVGGLPASAFLRAPQPGSKAAASSATAATPQAAGSIGGSGKINFLPLWTATGTLGSSTLFEKGGRVGIGTINPATALDVNGVATFHGGASIIGPLSISGSLAVPIGIFGGSNTSQIVNVTQTGTGSAITATTSSTSGGEAALYGTASATTGSARGLIGASASDSGIGVQGLAGGFGTGSSIGVQGLSISSAGTGVAGIGVTGVSGSGNNVGGLFQATGSSGFILKGLNPSGTNVFSVDGRGNLSTSGTLSGTGAAVAGNGLFAFIGDPGCGGFGTTALGFANAGLSNCSNYALRGDTGGNLYINSNSSGWMFFDHNNTGLMSLDPSGNLGVQGNIQVNGAGKGVSLSDGSQLGHLYLAKNDAGGGIQSSAVIVSLQVPAGSYFITAKTSLSNFDSSNQNANCALSTGDQSFLYLQSSPPEVVVALEDSATFTAPTTITLTCNTFNGFAERAKLAAVVVSGIN